MTSDLSINTGGTRWFILGAVMVEESIEPKTSQMIQRIKYKLGRDPKSALHWTKIRSHDKRLYMCTELLTEEWMFSCIVTDKTHPFIQKAQGLPEKWNLYFYSTRLLLERLSWYARDNGGEKAKLVFEKRTNMDYHALNDYLSKLQRWIPPLEIDWRYLDWRNIEIIAKEKNRMLQAVDLVCGGLSDALEYSTLGNIEPQYIMKLKERIYARGTGKNRLFSYGLKFSHVKGDTLALHGAEYPWLSQL